MTAIEAHGVGKRYGRSWALRDCTLSIPSGRVVALVGPERRRQVHPAEHGRRAHRADRRCASPCSTVWRRDRRAALDRIAFVAQDTPLYPNLSVGRHAAVGASLSRQWDEANARAPAGRSGYPACAARSASSPAASTLRWRWRLRWPGTPSC